MSVAPRAHVRVCARTVAVSCGLRQPLRRRLRRRPPPAARRLAAPALAATAPRLLHCGSLAGTLPDASASVREREGRRGRRWRAPGRAPQSGSQFAVRTSHAPGCVSPSPCSQRQWPSRSPPRAARSRSSPCRRVRAGRARAASGGAGSRARAARRARQRAPVATGTRGPAHILFSRVPGWGADASRTPAPSARARGAGRDPLVIWTRAAPRHASPRPPALAQAFSTAWTTMATT
jgi:hypothetical protein